MAKPVILLIDDEKIVLESLLNQLKGTFGFQYAYETATGVEEAWEIFNELIENNREIPLIISDWLMPKQRGDEFLIAVYERWPSTAQIMLSGYADQDSIERAFQYANLKAFIAKPWDEQELIDAVKKALAIEPKGDSKAL